MRKLLFCLLGLLACIGCGRRQAAWYEGIYDLSHISLSGDLAPALTAGIASLDAPLPTGKGPDAFLLFQDLEQRIRPVETRDEAGDEVYALWEAEPDNLLWMELAVNFNYLLHRDRDLARMSALPALNDTCTAVGAYFAARTRLRNPARNRMYRKAEQGMAELDSLSMIWLTINLSTVNYTQGDPVGAVHRLLDHLTLARRVGGVSCQARLWRSIAWRLSVMDRLDDALHAATLAAALYRRAGNDYGYASARITIASIMARRGESLAAIARLRDQADEMERHRYLWLMQSCLDKAAEIATKIGAYQQAMALDRRQLALTFAMGDSLNAPRNLVSIAHDFRMTGRMDSCYTYLMRAERIVKQFPDPLNLAGMAKQLAEYYCRVGNYAAAESLLMEARGLSSHGETADREARILLALLPQALEMGRVDLAYAWLDRLRTLQGALYSKGLDQNLQADFQMLSADLLARQGEFRAAEDALQRAAQAIAAGGGEGRQWQLASRQGDLALLREDYPAAEQAFTTCLDLARQGSDPDLLARSRFRLGHLYLETGRIPAALELFAPASDDTAFGSRYRTRLVGLLLTGIAHQREGHHEQALAALQQGLDLLNPDSPRDLVLRFQLARGRSLAATGSLDEAQQTLRQILDQAGQIPHQPSFDFLKVFHDNVRREAAFSLIALYHAHPELLPSDRLATGTLALTGIFPGDIPHPDPGSPWLVFLVGGEQSWSWLLTNTGTTLSPLPARDELRRLLRPVLADMVLPGRPVDQAAASDLTELLLGPARNDWQRDHTLTLVPDGLLHDVPWSALPLQADNSAGRTEPVLEFGAIREYVPGPGPGRPPVSVDSLAMLAIGSDSAPATNGRSATLPRLHHAREEATLIRDLWPGRHNRLLSGEDASWDRLVTDDLTSFGVIHLASHAQVHQGLPGQSTLRLAGGQQAAPVTIPAVSRLNLHTELVYLSCCNAARRLSVNGSGISDFARAFLAAGSRTVIASTLWVDDEASAFMAERFYRHWLEGMTRAKALRAAQQDLRAARETWRHPAYWAFFRLMGADE